ncbi:MAG: DedA family protein [Clostridia bacterium]|nr:DedA family protein [Clostridia bacterium]MDQ7790584.1 DedA family protein [Clostridia bacterium]
MDLILTYLTALGLGGVGAGMVLEALGVPCFPGGIIIILAGFLCSQGRMEFQTVLVVAFVAYTVGSIAAYIIGKNFGEPFFKRYGRYLGVGFQELVDAQNIPARSAGAFILLGRFVPGVGNLTPYVAGLVQLQLGWFLFYNSFYAVIWSSIYLYVGMFFGNRWPAIIAFIQPRLVGIAILGGLLVLAFLVIRDRRQLKVR